MTFFNYVSDALRIITENTAQFAGGSYLTVDYDSLINPKARKKTDAKTEAIGILKQMGIEVIPDGSI